MKAVDDVDGAIRSEKQFSRTKKIENRKTKDYDKYLEQIKDNIKTIISKSNELSSESSPDPKKKKSV